MANVTYDLTWREAMAEVLDLLETEHPEDPSLAPKELGEWACVYVKYLQIFVKLEEAYDQMVHPQKRADIRKVLEATIGRILEIRQWMVKLNSEVDHVHMEDILLDMKMGPEALEVPVPRYYVEERSKELGDRDKFLEALVEKYVATGVLRDQPQPTYLDPKPALPRETALRVLQANERGRQGRARAAVMKSIKSVKALEERRAKSGKALTQEEAAIKIQCAVRRFIARCRVRRMREEELVFLGMKPRQTPSKDADPSFREARNLLRRKVIQRENQAEYEEALGVLKRRIYELEGQDMRETIQDRINTWFIENRNAETGEYPDFPEEDDGGSKLILTPPPPELEKMEEEKGKGKKDDKAKGKKDDKKGAEEKADEPRCAAAFIPAVEQAVQHYVRVWQDRDEAGNFHQKYDPELVKDELRPLVFEEVRQEVDREMRVLLENLKEMVEVERAAKLGKKRKKGKKKKGKKKGKKDKKGKKKKDPTADRSVESLFAELVSNGIVRPCPKVHVQDYLGLAHVLSPGEGMGGGDVPPPAPGTTGAASKGDPSMAQVRQLVTEYCLLPLGSQQVNELAPFNKGVLFYGPRGSGKTLLSRAVANLAGATWFDLSPSNTDGKYSGKQVALMIHMVFKVARLMAPSVIYIDEAEKVFLSDKKKLKEYGSQEPYNRIKKDLLKEWKTVMPGERVMVIGNSSEPWICAKKDEKAFMSFWSKFLYFPLPDDASRKHLWNNLFVRHGAPLPFDFPTPVLARVTEGLSSGQIDCVVRTVLSQRRKETLSTQPIEMNELLQFVCKVRRYMEDDLNQYRDWTNRLPTRVKKDDKPGPKDDGKGKKKK